MDKELMFEHMLREHVIAQRARCENVLRDNGIGEYSCSVDISYDADDGGKWRIVKYLSGGDYVFKAAELEAAVNGWIMLYNAQNNAKILRSTIAGPSASIKDDNIPF